LPQFNPAARTIIPSPADRRQFRARKSGVNMKLPWKAVILSSQAAHQKLDSDAWSRISGGARENPRLLDNQVAGQDVRAMAGDFGPSDEIQGLNLNEALMVRANAVIAGGDSSTMRALPYALPLVAARGQGCQGAWCPTHVSVHARGRATPIDAHSPPR
jgi:hypothetical protein